ncbi:MAG: sigma-70 family RNA polymerase sigma factor [Lachnospiraceae bacterium]|nr:sigma-70 family RNA polymerase sigma factor [Lachnospiraceae bacterium]
MELMVGISGVVRWTMPLFNFYKSSADGELYWSRPERFAVFLGKITRNLSLDKCRYNRAEKRGSGQLPLLLEELHDCIPSDNDMEQVVETMALTELLNGFLESLSPDNRKIFMRRYWYFSEIKEIAGDLGMSESKVKMSLLRSRKRLKQLLDKEGAALSAWQWTGTYWGGYPIRGLHLSCFGGGRGYVPGEPTRGGASGSGKTSHIGKYRDKCMGR